MLGLFLATLLNSDYRSLTNHLPTKWEHYDTSSPISTNNDKLKVE